MRNTLLLAIVLVIVAPWALTQQDTIGITGCLVQSGWDYQVVDAQGRVHNLTGDPALVRDYLNHEVAVTGVPTTISLDTTQEHTASSVQQSTALEVQTVMPLGESCRDDSLY